MLGEVFYWVLNMSVLGTIMGLIILLIRKIIKLPPLGLYILWIVPFLRFWMPVGIASPYSFMNLIGKFTMRTVGVHEGVTKLPEITAMNAVMAAESYAPISYKYDWHERIFEIFAGVWIVFFAVALILVSLLYYFAKHEIKGATYLQENVYQSNKITAPAVYGVFSPKIVLPCTILQEDLPYILLHEKVHMERRDNMFRIAAIITACLHWFNPLMWIFLKCFFEDMEFACDAKVLKNYHTDEKKAYAKALLNVIASKSLVTSAFGGAKVKVRIEKVLSYRRLTTASAVFFVTFILMLTLFLLTNSAR